MESAPLRWRARGLARGAFTLPALNDTQGYNEILVAQIRRNKTNPDLMLALELACLAIRLPLHRSVQQREHIRHVIHLNGIGLAG